MGDFIELLVSSYISWVIIGIALGCAAIKEVFRYARS